MVQNAPSNVRVAVIALSRSTAPVEVREQLARQQWDELMATLAETAREWAILSTCHRFELYVAAESDHLAALCSHIERIFSSIVSQQTDYEVSAGQEPWGVRLDEEAVLHLCRVAAGLDSLVLGEAQIQGQVIDTYTAALEAGTAGPVLSALFRTAIRVGKRARTETSISTRAVSMSSIALNMAARELPEFQGAKVLVIGAGEMSRLALKALYKRQIANVTVANRTLSRAEAALLHPQWRAIGLAEAGERLADYDVIFSATSAHHFIITGKQLATLRTHAGSERKQVLIDMAVPRDIDPATAVLPGVRLVDVDDLRHGLDQSLASRKEALPAVNAILEDEMQRWHSELRELALRPYVVELRLRAERIRQQEVERTMRFIGAVDEATFEHIEHLSHALVNKLLHEPTVRIKELAYNGEAETYVSTICDIFGLTPGFPLKDGPLQDNPASNNPARDNGSHAELRSQQTGG